MFTYKVIVSLAGKHYFTVDNIASKELAARIHADMVSLYRGYDAEITTQEWTVPHGGDIVITELSVADYE